MTAASGNWSSAVEEADGEAGFLEPTEDDGLVREKRCVRRLPDRRMVRRLAFAATITALGLACLGAVARIAQGSIKDADVAASPVEKGAVELQELRQEWQCDGGPNNGIELEPRLMDVKSSSARVRCCRCTADGNERRGVTPEPCSQDVTWEEARQVCKDLGHRLCTKEELQRGEATSDKCFFNDHFVWATDHPYGFTLLGADSVCRLDMQDHTFNAGGSALVVSLPSPEVCEKECAQEDTCTGYEYRTDERRCEIWRKPIGYHITAVHANVFQCKVKTCPV